MKKVEVYFLINLGAILSLFAIEGELSIYMQRQDDILKNVAKKVAISIATFLSVGCLFFILKLNDLQKIMGEKDWVYSIYFRLENYFYGFHIYKKYPFIGTGFPSQIANYYQDYQQYLRAFLCCQLFH